VSRYRVPTVSIPGKADIIAARRRQLAALVEELKRLRGQYDLLMSAFKFDAARVLYPRIEAAERERRELEAVLPPSPPDAPPAPYSVARRRTPRRGR
jgi:hypothetical protein